MHRTKVATRLIVAAGALALACAHTALAGTVTIPIRLDQQFLRRLVVAKVFTAPGERAELWRDPKGCGHLLLEKPEVQAKDGHLTVRSNGDARWGAAVGTSCVLPLRWRGIIEVKEQPSIDGELPIVRFRVVDTLLLDTDGRTQPIASKLWDWIKGYVHPRMESVAVDLHEPVEELRAWLPLMLPGAYAASADVTLASVTLAGVRVENDTLVIETALASPDVPPGTPAAKEPPLDLREVEQWDAFLTFVVKRSASEVEDESLRRALLGVLLESRYDIVAALQANEPGASDPVPALFRRAWTRLAPVLRTLDDELPGNAALRYLAFVAAGDALVAIERLGPGSGLDISAAGLRRLARMLAPDETRDPLAYATVVDPELRDRLGFGAPLPAPPLPADAFDALEDVTTTLGQGAGETTTTVATQPPAPTTTLPATPPPPLSGLFDLLLDWLVPRAEAAGELPDDTRKRLRNWVPTSKDLDEYLPLVRQVLRNAADDTLAKKPVDARFVAVFRPLVLATAWKESCWRQFVRRHGKVVTMRSSAGALGIMQVNPRVWRGFYDVAALGVDTEYNARAGIEILRHYFVDYALRRHEHERGGGIDALPRATYAAYNGGPGHLSRYRKPTTAKSLRAIDAEFWRVYQIVKAGNELGVRACFGQ